MLVVLATFPSAEVARSVTTTLVEERLVACGNLIPTVESVYRWEGKIEKGDEALVLFKTTKSAYPRLEARLRELHPYQVPEIIALPPSHVLAAYASWVRESVGE